MICAADTVGMFQIESRAQMSMLPRLRPRCFYDLVIEVAIVRPGPIQGRMVHPYLRRRNGEEPIAYPDEKVKAVLGKTLGVPLFQEQAMALSMVAAGFSADEADQLRRAMAAWKRKGNLIERFGRRLISGMRERGYSRDFAERCFEQIKGFSEYGFPESHAASFALIVYVSAWLKRFHPAAFAAGLINSQPMGFYAPAQIVRDARDHGVEVRPVDVNQSQWDCTLEERHEETGDGETKRRRNEGGDVSPKTWGSDGPVLRLGLRLIKGLRQEDADAIAEAVRRQGPFRSVDALHRASGVRVATMRRLAQADAFNSMELDRQAGLWQVRALRDERLPILDEAGAGVLEQSVPLPAVPEYQRVRHDYASTGLSLKAHPMSFIRDRLDQLNAIPAERLADEEKCPHGAWVAVAGVVLVRQRPGTASGIIFMTLEDETGVTNLIVRPRVYDRFRKAARHGIIILVRGQIERLGEVVHIMVTHITDLTEEAPGMVRMSRDFH